MSKYRKVDPRIWNDEKFRGFTRDGKLVFFFLLTHPHMTAVGAMRAAIPGLAAEMGWPEYDFREALEDALTHKMVEVDENACLISLPNFMKYNRPENPNVLKAWVASLIELPECPLKNQITDRLKAFAQGLSKAFREALPQAFGEGVGKGWLNLEQEQEPEPEPEKELEQRRQRPRFVPPTTEEVRAYCDEKGYTSVDPDRFVSYYGSIGWVVGKRQMKSWRHAVAGWYHRNQGENPTVNPKVDKALTLFGKAGSVQVRRDLEKYAESKAEGHWKPIQSHIDAAKFQGVTIDAKAVREALG
jgi:hypothetical protein